MVCWVTSSTSILTGMNEPLVLSTFLWSPGLTNPSVSLRKIASARLVQAFHTGTSILGSLAIAATPLSVMGLEIPVEQRDGRKPSNSLDQQTLSVVTAPDR